MKLLTNSSGLQLVLLIALFISQNLILTVSFRSHNLVAARAILTMKNSFDQFFGGSKKRSIEEEFINRFTDNAPPLNLLQEMLVSQQTPEEKEDFELQKIGRGSTNARALIRLFDAPNDHTPEVTLYRDSAGNDAMSLSLLLF
jgi:hypothetical protein